MKTWVGGKCKNCGKNAGPMVKCDTCSTTGCVHCVGSTTGQGMQTRCKACGDTRAFLHYVK